MDIKPIIRLDEVPKTIILPNPGGRELLITPEESGVEEEQVFTSEDKMYISISSAYQWD